MSMQRIAQVAAFAVATSAILPSFAAVPNAGGEYTFSASYGNDYRTTGQTGDQIWNVQNPITVGAFYPGQTDIVPYWQIYRGAAITGTSNTRVMKGNVVFENALKWAGNDENYIGYTGPVKLCLRNGGSFSSATSGENIPRYSDRVVLPDGDYAVTLDEDWAIGELSVGAGAALKFDLPSDATATNVVPLTVSGKVEADAAAGIVLDAAAFGRAYKNGSVTLMSCEVASPGALQTLSENVSFAGADGRRLGRVDVAAGGTALVYTALPSGTRMIFR